MDKEKERQKSSVLHRRHYESAATEQKHTQIYERKMLKM